MRDLSMMEIEMVAGGGWFSEWWGGVTESIQNWMTSVQQFFNNAPRPTSTDIQNIQNLCNQAGGVQSVTITSTGSTATMTVAGPAVSASFTSGGGSFTATCFPSGGEQG